MRFGGFGFNQQFGFTAPSTVTAVAGGSSLGPELVTNGDMGSATGWTLSSPDPGSSLAISGGKMNYDNAAPDEGATASQETLFPPGTYRTSFKTDSIAGTGASVRIIISDGEGTIRSTAATFSEDLVVTMEGTFYLQFGGSANLLITLDDVSIKEVLS